MVCIFELFPAFLREEMREVCIVLKKQAYRKNVHKLEDFMKMCILYCTLILCESGQNIDDKSIPFHYWSLNLNPFELIVIKSCDHF